MNLTKETHSEHSLSTSTTVDHPRRRSDVTARLVEGEMVVLDREADVVHRLNQTASFIWGRCDGRSTVRDIAIQLADAFDVAPDVAEASVTAALQQFEECRLLERAPD